MEGDRKDQAGSAKWEAGYGLGCAEGGGRREALVASAVSPLKKAEGVGDLSLRTPSSLLYQVPSSLPPSLPPSLPSSDSTPPSFPPSLPGGGPPARGGGDGGTHRRRGSVRVSDGGLQQVGRREGSREMPKSFGHVRPVFICHIPPSLPLSLPPSLSLSLLRRGHPGRVLKLHRRMRRRGVEPSASALTQVRRKGREGGREGGREERA